MDYFYAQVEIRDNPALINKAVGIGGPSTSRGVLCTCNYIARKYGVRSAMPTFQAMAKCPELVLIRPNMKKYKEASEAIFSIFSQYTDQIQGLSLDEAFLDVTDSLQCFNSATWMAMEIKDKVYKETGLTGSAGISFNKLLAKISSDLNKPNGICALIPENFEKHVPHFDIAKISGVGKVTQTKMRQMGINNFGDLRRYSKLDLINYFGSFGSGLYDFCRGIDDRSVVSSFERKSLSVERTFSKNISNIATLKGKVYDCYNEMVSRLEKHSDRIIKSVFIKIKYSDFKSTTFETAYEDLQSERFIQLFLERYAQRGGDIRLIGTGVRFHSYQEENQLLLPFAV